LQQYSIAETTTDQGSYQLDAFGAAADEGFYANVLEDQLHIFQSGRDVILD